MYFSSFAAGLTYFKLVGVECAYFSHFGFHPVVPPTPGQKNEFLVKILTISMPFLGRLQFWKIGARKEKRRKKRVRKGKRKGKGELGEEKGKREPGKEKRRKKS